MSKTNNLTDFLTDIANTIRAKKGTTDPINPQDFSTEIANLPGGGGNLVQVISRTVTELTADDLKGVTKIGWYAFRGCTSLTSITIPDSVTSIDMYAFQGCESLVNITIPNSVTSFGTYAFYGCSGLTSVKFNAGVKAVISYDMFANCSSLKELDLGDSITSIDQFAFDKCSELVDVIIPDSVASIGGYAFQNCKKLTNVTIGNSVTSMGSSVFYGSNLTTVVLRSIIPPTITSNTFPSKVVQFIVPVGTSAAYKSATNWSKYADKIVEAS